jgi:hypothetical protein
MELLVNIGIKEDNEIWKIDKNCGYFYYEYEDELIADIPDIEDHVVWRSIDYLINSEKAESLKNEWEIFNKNKDIDSIKFEEFLRRIKNHFCTVHTCAPYYTKYYTAGVLAKKIGVSRQRINQLVRENNIKGAYQMPDKRRTWLIPAMAITFLRDCLKDKQKPGPKKKIKVDTQENIRPDHAL